VRWQSESSNVDTAFEALGWTGVSRGVVVILGFVGVAKAVSTLHSATAVQSAGASLMLLPGS